MSAASCRARKIWRAAMPAALVITSPSPRASRWAPFTAFALCHGQSQVAKFGFAPMPPSLVKDGLQQIRQIPGHGHVPSLSRCLGAL